MSNILRFLLAVLFVVMIVACGYQNQEQNIPSSVPLHQNDLVGTWEARYGLTNVDTLILRADGTYQQTFEAPESNYYYKSPWNKWYIEHTDNGRFRLHLEGMRYYAYTIELGESGGRLPTGDPISFYDVDEQKTLKMTDQVILRVKDDNNFPGGITLWHMHFDLDMSPPYFVLVNRDSNEN